MKKVTIFCAVLCLALLLAACGGTADYPVMEPVALDALTLETGESDTMSAQFPAGEWFFDVSLTPVDFGIYDMETLTSETGTVNVNIILSGAYSGKLKQSDFDGVLKELKNSDMAEGMEIGVAEMRTLAGEPVGYVESTTTYTENMIDFYLENSGITEEQLEAMGGREALLNAPPTRQIQIYAVVDGNIAIVTGTYYDDASKERLLDVMNILLQTAEVK